MSNGRIYTKICNIKGIFRLCFLIIFVNICIAGLLQYYTRETDSLRENLKYQHSEKQLEVSPEPTTGFKKEKTNLHWIYYPSSSLQGKLQLFNNALSKAIQTPRTNKEVAKSTIANGTASFSKIIGQRPTFFKQLSKYADIETFLLSWYPMGTSGNQTRTYGEIRHTVNALLPIKVYYRCRVDTNFYDVLQYPTNSSLAKRVNHHRSSQMCSKDITDLGISHDAFNPAFFNYHNSLPLSIYELVHYGIPQGFEEGALSLQWNPPCVRCGRYPDFITYSSVIHGLSVIDNTGKIYYKDALIIPFSCLYPWNWEPNITTYQASYKLPNNRYQKVFVASQQFDNNYYHGIAECIIKLILYVDFLKDNPDIVIHILSLQPQQFRDTPILEKMARVLGIHNRIVTGPVRSNVTILPMGMGCLNPAVIPLQLASRKLQQYITEQHGEDAIAWDSILVIKRNDRLFMEHSKLITELQFIVNASQNEQKLNILEFDCNQIPSLMETMAMFHRAKIIVASHGAGLTNMIFSRPGTVIIEANCHAPMGRPCYRNMAYKLGLRYYGLLTKSTRDDGYRCSKGLNIDFDAMKRVIRYVIDEVFN